LPVLWVFGWGLSLPSCSELCWLSDNTCLILSRFVICFGCCFLKQYLTKAVACAAAGGSKGAANPKHTKNSWSLLLTLFLPLGLLL
jgi:hypothetical protein